LTASSNSDSTALLGKFAGFLTNSAHLSQENLESILTALVASTVHNFWVIDLGASDHITNKMTSLHHFKKSLLQLIFMLQMENMSLSKVDGKLNCSLKMWCLWFYMFHDFHSNCFSLAKSLKH